MKTEVVEAVFDRSGHLCEAGTPDCTGRANKIHHRHLKGQGGPDLLENLLHVCLACHLWIHANPTISYENGWMIRSGGLGWEGRL